MTTTAVAKAAVAPAAAAGSVSAYVTGDVFAGLSNGTIAQFDGNGTAKRSLTTGGASYETGMCFDGAGNLYSTNFGTSNMTKFDNVGTQVSFPWAGTAFGAANPESCVVDNHQHVYVGSVDSGSLKEFDANGTLLKTFAPATEDRGLDWIDLSGDQCTMLYTSEGSSVRAFDVCANKQLADFATNLPAPCFALRILKDGRVAVACASEVVLLSKSGTVTTTYTGASLGNTGGLLFAFNVTPDNSAFWTADLNTGDIWKVRFSDGAALTHLNGGAGVSGLAVFGEGGTVGEPLRPSETYGGGGLAGNNPHCNQGRPVDCATGNFWHTFSDLRLPGRGLPLDLNRTYNALGATTDSPFGFGWSSSYTDHLSVAAGTGEVTVTQENGSTSTFQSDGAGAYTAPPRVFATLTKNTDGTFEFVRRNQQTFTFSASGVLLSEKDVNGYTTALSYGSDGHLATVTDQAGRMLSFTFGAGGKVATATDPAGRRLSYTYDGAGDLTGVTDVAGGSWTYGYDTDHRMVSMTDPRRGVVSNVYNPAGQVTKQTDPQGRATSFAYITTADGTSTTITDPKGNVTVEDYTASELTKLTKGSGTRTEAVWTFAYDQFTLGVTAVTDPNGNITRRSYDPNGNLTSVTDPLGRTASATYNSFAEPLSATDPAGTTTTYTYDATGNARTVRRPLTATSSVQQTSLDYTDTAHPGDATVLNDPSGKSWRFAYSGTGDLVATTDPLGQRTSYSYDGIGRRTSMISARGNISGARPSDFTTTYISDAFGDVTKSSDPLGHFTATVYDANRNRTSVTDPSGNATAYSYNADDQLTKVTRADGSTLPYSYDAAGNQTTQTDAAGNATTYAYDPLNRVSTTTDPLGRSTAYHYDGAGNRTSLVDPSGQTTSFGYDSASQLTGVSYSNGTTPNVTYSYDVNGQRASMVDGTGSTSYAYDSLNRLTSSTVGSGAQISYDYDLAGQLTSLTYPNGQKVNRTYDDAGHLANVTDWLGNSTNYGYDANANLTAQTYPNGVKATSGFNNADQLTSISDQKATTTLASFTYTRDNMGQVASSTPTGVPGGPESYGYTKLNELTSVNAKTFGYDHADNLTRLADGTTQTFDAANELLSSTATGTASGSPAVDQVVSGDQRQASSKITSPVISTTSGNELVLAFVSTEGPDGSTRKITGVTGGGLTWSLARLPDGGPCSENQGNLQIPIWYMRESTYQQEQKCQTYGRGTAEVWQAYATAPISTAVTANVGLGRFDGSITVATFTGAAHTVGATAGRTANRPSAPATSLKTTRAGSVIWAVGHAWDHAATVKPLAGQTIAHQFIDTRTNSSYWTQRTTGAITASGTTLVIGDTAPTTDRWQLAAVEIVPSSDAGSAPGTPTTFTYDRQGNRITSTSATGTSTALAYDQANRLTGYGTTTAYTYNGDGLRAAKTASGATTAFAWDQSSAIPLLLADGSDYYVYGAYGHAIEKISGTTVTYLHQDQQGSTKLLTDGGGSIVGTYSYDPYGKTTSHSGAAVSLQYNGEYTDAETGFQYLRARYYDPATGQFLSKDPIAALTHSAYSYAGLNPLNAVDPSGLSWWNPISWTKKTWENTATGIGVVGLGLGVVAVTVVASPIVIGGGIVLGGVAAGIGLGVAAADCFETGWGTADCGKQINHANINTLYTATTSWFAPGAEVAKTVAAGALGIASTVAQYLGGLVVDKLFKPVEQRVLC